MGKRSYINPVLSTNKKNQSGERKIRSDKLHDIKIPVTEKMDYIIRRNAKLSWNGSKTSLGTELVIFALDNLFIYPDVTYQDSPYIVHVKVNHETYQRIGEYASEWKCSIRKAAHRIFIAAYHKKQLGGIGDGI